MVAAWIAFAMNLANFCIGLLLLVFLLFAMLLSVYHLKPELPSSSEDHTEP